MFSALELFPALTFLMIAADKGSDTSSEGRVHLRGFFRRTVSVRAEPPGDDKHIQAGSAARARQTSRRPYAVPESRFLDRRLCEEPGLQLGSTAIGTFPREVG
jgi:hypothetical protein